MSKILDSVWFNNIGIVKTFNGHETKWYIGGAQGNNKELDEKRIALAGVPFHPKALKNFFKTIKEEEDEIKLEEIRMQHLKEIEEQLKKKEE